MLEGPGAASTSVNGSSKNPLETSAALLAASQYIVNDLRSNGLHSDVAIGASNSSEEVTAHQLGRIIVTKVISPLVHVPCPHLHSSRPGLGLLEALHALQRMVEERSKFLEHLFATNENGVIDERAPFLYSNTTFDVWVTPRFLSASASTLAAAQNQADPEQKARLYQQASDLLTSLVLILKTSIESTGQIDNVRLVLLESTRTAVQALSFTGETAFAPHTFVPDILLPEDNRRNNDGTEMAQPKSAQFFASDAPSAFRLSTRKDRSKPCGECPSALSLEQNSSCFDFPMHAADGSHTSAIDRASALLCSVFDLILRLATEHPSELLDVAEFAVQLFVAHFDHTWARQKQEALNRNPIVPWSAHGLHLVASHAQVLAQFHRPKLLRFVETTISQLTTLLEVSEESIPVFKGSALETVRATHQLFRACNLTLPIEDRHLLSTTSRPYFAKFIPALDKLIASVGICDENLLATVRCAVSALTLGLAPDEGFVINGISHFLASKVKKVMSFTSQDSADRANQSMFYPQTRSDLDDLAMLQTLLDTSNKHVQFTEQPAKRRKRLLSGKKVGSTSKREPAPRSSDSETVFESYERLRKRIEPISSGADLGSDAANKELSSRQQTLALCGSVVTPTNEEESTLPLFVYSRSKDNVDEGPRYGYQHEVQTVALDTFLQSFQSSTGSTSVLGPRVMETLVRMVNQTPFDEALPIGGDSTAFSLVISGLRAKSRKTRLLTNELAFALQGRVIEQGKLTTEKGNSRRLQQIPQLYSELLETKALVKLHETAIIGLARLSTLPVEACQERCLLTLVLQISSTNPFVTSCAYSQIVKLATEQRCTTFQLLRPYLKVISTTIVERFISMPDIWTAFLNLIKMSQAAFFNVTIEFTLPHLITLDSSGATDIGATMIGLIAQALGTEVAQLCLDNSAPILRSFFTHSAQFRNRDLSKLMNLIKLDANNLKGLLRSRQADVVGYLVVQLGNAVTSKAAYAGLLFFVDTLTGSDVEPQRADTEASRRKLADFLEAEILSVLAYINHDIAGDHGRRSNAEKSDAIRSIGALVPIIGMPITAVTPQIMATLNSNLQERVLMLAVLQSWKEFIRTFKFDDIGPIVGQTAAALLSVWDRFDKEQEEVAISILEYLILENASYLKNAESLKDHIDDIPSLDRLRHQIPDICKALRDLREKWTNDRLFRNILDRTANENVSISHESLKELQVFLVEKRAYIEELTSGDMFSPMIGQCVRTLMRIVAKGDTQPQDICDITYRCFGLIGAVDPDRIEHVVEEPHKIVLNNFEDQDEAIDFAVHLIQDLLVPAFRAADDTTHQSCLAYAIQELLKISGFTSAMLSSNSHARPVSIKTRQRMDGMNREVFNTILPLLESKYMAQAGRVTPKESPIYENTETYREWLQSWATALIVKVQERHEALRSNLSTSKAAQSAAAIFGVFRIAIRDHDISIARHLLPHLVLHSIISGTNQDRQSIIEEAQAILSDQVIPTFGYSEERRLLTTQTLFIVMDHIGVWMRRKRQDLSKSARRPRNLVGGEDALAEVEMAMRYISQELTAQASLKCKTYSRALLNFENRVRSMRSEGRSDTDMQPYYENLHRIYAQLDEPDGMEGISTRVISPSLEHQIREHESTGRWTSAQSCWEVKLQQNPNDPDLHLGLLRCLRNLGHYDTMRTHIRGALSLCPRWELLLDPFRVEGACILGDWQEVYSRISKTQAQTAEHSIGRALLAMRGSDDNAFECALTEARREMGGSLIAAGKTSYPSIYDAVLNLHMLHEIELIRSNVAGKAGRITRANVNDLNKSLTARLNATLPSFRTQEPLLSLRRTALSAMQSHSAEVGEAWISTAKIARRAGHIQTAYSATLQATQQKAPFAFVQRVKLLAQEEQTHAAIQDLNNSLSTLKNTFKDSRPSKGPLIELQQTDNTGQPLAVSRASYAKACLLRARLLDSTFRYSAAEILDKFRDANREQTESEKIWYYLGHFQDSHEGLLPDWIAQRHNVCRSFLKSAALGTKYFYRTLPRVVTIWMDIAADEQIMSGRKGTGSDTALATKLEAFKSINRLIRRSSETIKPFQWFAVFPQLVARIVQKNEDAWVVLLEIIIQVLGAYPQQAMWSMVAGNNSKDPERKRRYGEIVSRINSKGSTHQKDVVRIIVGSQRMAKELLRLCDYEVPKQETVLSMTRLFPGLLEIANTSGLLLPLQSSMTVLLPANHLISDQHRPFPSDLPMIHSFDDSIEIMNSLQKPRKVMIVGSDCTRYPFLVKPKDDLRKDARLMEFDSMINKLLQSQPEARKRKLHVRTYAVLILNEEHGLIEWVPNTIGFRHILNKLYAARDMVMYNTEIKVLMEEARLSPDPKTTEHIFREKILARYPPVFFEWFLATFPDPTAWLKARSAYARTAAVMSMVGFVLGLGDRHGENILFDSVSGDTVHVDLNCLFDKGQKFEIPERVPFRLTQNMVDAMGVTGYDGAFRKSAEITMSILRNNKESLMSVLEAMVHDPLGEWGVPDDRNRARNTTTTRLDPRVVEARRALDPVAHKLDGRIYRLGMREPTPPYTINNLVDALIKEATAPVNLAKMYVGWSSWL